MAGVFEDVSDRAVLDDDSGIHHVDPVGDLGDDPQVVGDVEHRQGARPLQGGEKPQDLGLDGDIQGRGRLVGDDELRPAGERHGDHHPLALPAAQLVRVIPEPFLRPVDADILQQLCRERGNFRGRHGGVNAQGFGDLLADGQDRVQGGQGFLEHHADAPSPDTLQLGFIQAEQVVAAENDPAAGELGRRAGDEAHDGQSRNGFPAARLAHEADGLALSHLEVHPIHGPRNLVLAMEIDLEVLNRKQYFGVFSHLI